MAEKRRLEGVFRELEAADQSKPFETYFPT
jgi:hypothetical protein